MVPRVAGEVPQKMEGCNDVRSMQIKYHESEADNEKINKGTLHAA